LGVHRLGYLGVSPEAWSYSARIPEGADSRTYAFAPLLVGVLVEGIGAFLANDIARHVPLWGNAVVWSCLIQAMLCILVWAWMFWGKWVWTTPQMAVFGVSSLAPVLWAFQGAPLLSFLLYSGAPTSEKLLISSTFLGWHFWWARRTAKLCLSIWNDPVWRIKVWAPYNYATVYRQFAAKAAMDAAGIKWYPGALGLTLPLVSCIPLYLYRYEVISYLDVPFVPLMGFVLGAGILVLITTAITAGVVMMLVIPARIVADTGTPVLVDMMTSTNAKV
jgi:hypothetical protein